MTAQDTITIPLPKPPSISVQGEGGSELLRIDPDGTVSASDLILAQEAGRVFANSVRHYLTAPPEKPNASWVDIIIMGFAIFGAACLGSLIVLGMAQFMEIIL